MYIRANYGFVMTGLWSKKPFLLGLAYALVVNLTIHLLNSDFSLPWQPVSVIGVAVAFYLGFKNNSSYDRTWEARKIWGGIVNSSRTFGASVVTFVQGADAPSIHRELIHRHVAWLTALRHQLRTPRPWEHDLGQATNPNRPRITERPGTLCTSEMAQYLAPAELHALEHQSNMAAQLLKTQSVRLQQLRRRATSRTSATWSSTASSLSSMANRAAPNALRTSLFHASTPAPHCGSPSSSPSSCRCPWWRCSPTAADGPSGSRPRIRYHHLGLFPDGDDRRLFREPLRGHVQ